MGEAKAHTEALLDKIHQLERDFENEDFRKALDLIQALPSQIRESPRTLMLEGYATYRLDDDERGQALLEKALEKALASEPVDKRTAAWAATRLSEVNEHWRRLDKAIEYADKAKELLPSRPGAELLGAVNLAYGRALVSNVSNEQTNEGFKVLGLARNWFRKSGDTKRELFTLRLEIGDLVHARRFRKAWNLSVRQTKRIEMILANTQATVQHLKGAALCMVAVGDLEKCVDIIEKASKVLVLDRQAVADVYHTCITGALQRAINASLLLRRILNYENDPKERASVQVALTAALFEKGELGAAEKVARQLIGCPDLGHLQRQLIRANLAMTLLQTGRDKEAVRTAALLPSIAELEAMTAQYSSSNEHEADLLLETAELECVVREIQAILLMRRGDFMEATNILMKGDLRIGVLVVPSLRLYCLSLLIEAYASMGDEEAFSEIVRMAIDVLDGPAVSMVARANFHHTAGWTIALRGKPALGRNLLSTAASIYQSIGNVRGQGFALAYLSFVLSLLGKEEESIIKMEEAMRLSHADRLLKAIVSYTWAGKLWHKGRLADAKEAYVKTAAHMRATGLLFLESIALEQAAACTDNPRQATGLAWRSLRRLLSLAAAVPSERRRLEFLARSRSVGAFLVEKEAEHHSPKTATRALFHVSAGDFVRLCYQASTALPPQAFEEHQPGQGAEDPQAAKNADDIYRQLLSYGDVNLLGITASQVTRRLERNHAVIEYFITDPENGKLFMFVFRKGSVKIVSRAWRPAHARLVERCAVQIQGHYAMGTSIAPHLLLRSLQKLYRLLILPLEPLLDGIVKLTIASGAVLSSVPFPALVDRDGNFLQTRFVPSFLLSAAQTGLSGDPGWAKGRLAVILEGRPEIEGCRLQGLTTEIDTIERLLRSCGFDVMRLQSLKPDVLQHASLIHYSGHARFDDADPERASLFLKDETVTAADLAGIRLENQPLVVLCACETARTTPKGDELIGLVRSIFVAGAHTIISAAWQAHDDASVWLMGRFYERLLSEPSQSPASALHASSMELARAHPEWVSPFFWANFRCFGV